MFNKTNLERILECSHPTRKLYEYAEEESVSFIKWAVKNHSVDFEGFSFPVWIGGEEYNAEQLYQKYLESKNKK